MLARPHRHAACVGVLFVAVVSSACERALAQADPDTPTYVGEEMCVSCHAVEEQHWSGTLHALAFRGNPRTDLEARTCESCHGPGSEHLKDPQDAARIVSFTHGSSSTPEQMNGMCLSCHERGPLLHWKGSVHEWRDLACSDCHNPMARTSARSLLSTDRASTTCFTCHPQQRVEFRKRSHMPLLEGKVSCVDCHAPHGSSTDPLLKANSVNDVCYACHAEKRGPFLWEHPPVLDSCSNCHTPHGSNHPFLLTSKPPFLCQQCHAQIDDFSGHPGGLLTRNQLSNDERLLARSCSNCHAQIHGSNHPSGSRFHR